MSQIYPNVLADIIIGYTQRNNEPVGYFEQKAHMPKNVFLNQAPVSKKDPPPIGCIGYWETGNARPFVVVRNNEWPVSLLVLYPFMLITPNEVLFCKDAISDDFTDIHCPCKLDDYMYTVFEVLLAQDMEYVIKDFSVLEAVIQLSVNKPPFFRAFTEKQIQCWATEKQSRDLSNKQ